MEKYKHVLQIFASSSWGGGEQYVYDLSRELMKEGYSVYFVSRKSEGIEKKMRAINIPCGVLPMKGIFDLKSVFRLAGLIKKDKIDLIHVHLFKDAFTASFARMISRKKIKIVLTRHLVRPGKTGFLYVWLYKQLDRIIFISELAKKEFLSTLPSVDQKKISIVYNSIPVISPERSFERLRESYNIGDETTLLAFTGRLVGEKGVEVLIKSLIRIKSHDFLLLIAGKGVPEYEKQLFDLVRDNGLTDKVRFCGFVDNPRALIQQVDIGVVPSVGKEAFGLSVIEFMQAGKAVVTTNNGAQVEFVTDGVDGILIPPANEIALSEALLALINNKDLRQQIACHAKEHFEKELAYPFFFQKIIDIYER